MTCHVAVIGAGPCGLVVAAHLRDAGVEARVVGQPMAFWRQTMPHGMLLRSEWPGSHIADPRRALTFDRYEAARGTALSRPLPLADVVDYGLWYQRQAVPDLDLPSAWRSVVPPRGPPAPSGGRSSARPRTAAPPPQVWRPPPPPPGPARAGPPSTIRPSTPPPFMWASVFQPSRAPL